MSKTPRQPLSLGAFRMIEESFSLLRQNFGSFGLPYAIGTGAFLLYFAYFVEDLSFGVFEKERLLGHCFAVVFLYIWMRAWQCIACEQLRRSLSGLPEAEVSPGLVLRAMKEQAKIQGVAVWAWFGSFFTLLIGFGWAYSFGQCLVAQGRPGEGLEDRSKRAWSITNMNTTHVFSFIIANFAIWMVVLLNAGAAFSLGPRLVRQVLGLEMDIATSGWDLTSTTFTTIVFSLCYFVTDAFAKSYFSQLCFYGLSRKTGEDIAARFSKLKTGVLPLLFFGLGLAVILPSGSDAAEDRKQDEPSLEVRRSFDEAADDVLAQKEFAWRLPRNEEAESGVENGLLVSIAEWMSGLVDGILDGLDSFLRWLFDRDSGSEEPQPLTGGEPSGLTDGFLRALFLVGALGLLVGLFYVIARWDKSRAKANEEDDIVEEKAAPNLEDAGAHAAQLPTNSWLNLAIEKAGEGEYRLAVRAVFLASLALLGDRRVVRLAKHKSNWDYDQELRRRGLPVSLMEGYTDFCGRFDEVWYGSFEADQTRYEAALAYYRSFEEGLPR